MYLFTIWQKSVSEIPWNISPVCDGQVPPFRLSWVKAEVFHIWNTTPGLSHHIQGVMVQTTRLSQTKEVLHLSDLLFRGWRRPDTPFRHSAFVSGVQVVKPPEVVLLLRGVQVKRLSSRFSTRGLKWICRSCFLLFLYKQNCNMMIWA